MSHFIFWFCGMRTREVWYVVIEDHTASISGYKMEAECFPKNVRTHLQLYTVSL
jgi:hypothetical protein